MKSLESYHNWDSKVLPMIANLKITPQSEIHHAEGDVYVHTQMVVSEVEKILSQFPERSQKLLLYTALLHDIAKPMTTIWEEGDWRSPGHAKLGEAIAREILWKDFSMEDREEVASLIRFHGLPIWFADKQDVDMAVIGASLRCNLNELATFAQCDFRGRICNDLEDSIFKIELFKEKAQDLNCLNNPYQFTSDWARLHYFKNGEYPGKEIWEPEGAWCVVMCGMPGSGKNTWVERNWSGNIVEMDSIRKKHKISPRDKDAQGFVHQEAKEELRVSLRKKEDVLWNATNLTVQQRSIIIDLALQYKAKIKIVYVDCSMDLALIRNKEREEDKMIPVRAIEKMYRKLEMPTIAECHELIVIK